MSDLISRKEIIDRLERVIQNGVPSEDGMHPISAETVLEVVRGLSEHSTNLAEVGTDCISRRQAIDALGELATFTEDWSCHTWMYTDDVYNAIKQLPPIQPDISYIISETLHECGIYGEETTVKLIGTLKRLGRDDLLPPCVM